MNKWTREGIRWQTRGFKMISEFRRSQRRRTTRRQTNPVNTTSSEIDTALRTVSGYNTRNWQLIRLDNRYWVCSKSEFQRIVNTNTINEKQYVLDQFDCDNFAFTFKSQVAANYNLNNVGMVIDNSGGHAYNIVVFTNGTAELFEPQTDRWITPGESEMYSFKKGIILI
jgi:hypothetical protein